MPSETKKYTYKSFKSDKLIGDAFETHCSKLGLGMKESVDILFKFVTDNNISPDDLDFIWQKRARTELNNAKSELMQVHNLSVGFLRTFEKNQEAIFREYQTNLIQNLTVVLKKYQLQEAVLKEILYNSQVLLQLEDETFGKKISSKNWDNIIDAEKQIEKNDHQA